jgi:hypothetical protein
MRITVVAADCADILGTEAKNPPNIAQTSSAYLKLHLKARATDRVEPSACEFATLKRVIVRFRNRWNKKTPS